MDNLPYKQRQHFIREIRQCLMSQQSDWENTFNANLSKLKLATGHDHVEDQGVPALDLDKKGRQCISLLSKLVVHHPRHWKTEVFNICHHLLAHYSQPTIPGYSPDVLDISVRDLTKLSLMSTDLSQKKMVKTLDKVISRNRGLICLELAYTGLENKSLQSILSTVAKSPNLMYLGLRGNNLKVDIIAAFNKMLKNRKNFPRLAWVDFSHNADIFALPRPFLELLQSRWPSDGYRPSFRDLADGKAVVTVYGMAINV